MQRFRSHLFDKRIFGHAARMRVSMRVSAISTLRSWRASCKAKVVQQRHGWTVASYSDVEVGAVRRTPGVPGT